MAMGLAGLLSFGLAMAAIVWWLSSRTLRLVRFLGVALGILFGGYCLFAAFALSIDPGEPMGIWVLLPSTFALVGIASLFSVLRGIKF